MVVKNEIGPVSNLGDNSAILSKIKAVIYNARREGVYIVTIFLDKKDYAEFVHTTEIFNIIKTLNLGVVSYDHILWDGVQIVNNSLPLEEKKRYTGQPNLPKSNETKLVAEQLEYHKKRVDIKRKLTTIIHTLLTIVEDL